MALDVPDNNPQYDSDEILRQAMEGGLFPKADPAGAAPPMRLPEQGQPSQVPMAPNSFGSRIGSQYGAIPKPAAGPVVADMQPPAIASIAPGAQPRLDNPNVMPPAPSPLDPKAVDQSGKSKYRMSMGERIAGIAGNFLGGFASRGQSPTTYVGRNARNARWDQDQDLTEQNRKLYETATQGALRQGQIEKYESSAATASQRADTAEKALGEKSAQFKQSLEEKQREFDNKKPTLEEDAASRTKIADQMGLKKGSKERNSYILTGKLPGQDREGRQPTELETWITAFKRDNGREPTADEISNRKTRTSTKEDQITKDRDKGIADAETKAQKRISELKLFDPADPKKSPEERKAAIYADLEKEKGEAVRSYQERASQNAQHTGPRTPAASATNATNAKMSTDEAKSYLSKVGWDGKTQPTPEQKAKARQLAQKDKRAF